MPIPIQRLLKHHKLSPKHLKAAFDNISLESRPKVKKLVDNIRDTIRQGIERNRRDYRLFKAMDWAMDQPFYQISYTQLRGLISSQPDDKKVQETINSWGLTHLLADVMENGRPCCDPISGKPKKSINLPFLTNVFVPIVMAYHTIRLAKLFNDRNLTPLYKYEPSQFTRENRFRCEVVTQVVQKQAAWFGYPADERQSISQMLQYGLCINFPREAWFVEKQEDEDGGETIVREGVRLDMPHPSRMYADQFHRLSSLNTNSGCEYLGHWMLERYRDIHEHPLYWNKDRIQMGAQNWFDLSGSDFLAQVYPCSMSFPGPAGVNDPGGVAGVGALDRMSDGARCYNSGDFNTATLTTRHFQKIVPKDHGLGTYAHPVWFRFIFASDNAVLWAEPLAYDRFPTYCYDADFNRSRFRSLTLEVMPFQDQIGNLLSQWGLAVRENLRNPVFVDKDKIPNGALIALENHGNKTYSGREYIPFSATENYRFKIDQREAFYTPNMTHHNTAEIQQLITGVLDMLDRIMQLSPQEIGQAASHEQTAEESKIIAGNMSTRVQFTGGFIDDAIYAKKVMLYDAMMAYADDEITAGVSSNFAATEAEFNSLLKKVGFEITDKSKYDPQKPETLHMVKGSKKSLVIESFVSTREGADRIDSPAVADAMSKIFIAIASNPVLIQSIGAVQLVELLNQIIIAAGLPKEFRLRGTAVDPNAGQEEQANQLSEALKGFAEQVKEAIAKSQQETLAAAGQQSAQIAQQTVEQAMGQVGQELMKQLAPLAEAVQQANQVNEVQGQQLEQLAAAVVKVQEALVATAQSVTATMQPPAPVAQEIPPIMQPVAPQVPVGVPV